MNSSRSVDKGTGFEKLTIDIEHAVMNRCKDLIGVEASPILEEREVDRMGLVKLGFDTTPTS